MTKKDYELIAQLISLNRGNFKSKTAWHNYAKMVSYQLEIRNPKFKPHTFLTACGIED